MGKCFKTGYELTGNAGDDDSWKKFLSPSYPWYNLSTPELMDLRISQAARENADLHAAVVKVLATREHIPNKEERDEKRMKVMKAKKNSSKKPRMRR